MILKTKNEIETRKPAILNSEKKLGREILKKKSENCLNLFGDQIWKRNSEDKLGNSEKKFGKNNIHSHY